MAEIQAVATTKKVTRKMTRTISQGVGIAPGVVSVKRGRRFEVVEKAERGSDGGREECEWLGPVSRLSRRNGIICDSWRLSEGEK